MQRSDGRREPMRVFYLLPLAAVFGCAHQSSDQQPSGTTASAAADQSSQTAAATPSPAPTTSPGWTADEQAASNAPSATSNAGPAMNGAQPTYDHPPVAAAPASLPCPAVRVHFAFDSDAIEVADQPMLDQAARCLSNNDRLRVSVEGNADDIGSEGYNKDLGERRAESVAQYLENKGVSRDQLQSVISNGEDAPVCDQENAACRAQNRRTAVRATCHM
jgi:outer membrane protein OmpA-like peptidoglycan-associated protein